MTGGKSPYPAVYYASSSKQLARQVQSLLLRFNINALLKEVDQKDKGRLQHHVVVSGKPDIKRFLAEIGTVGIYKTEAGAEIDHYFQERTGNTNRDILPVDIWDLYAKPAMKKAGVSHRALHDGLEMAYSGMTIFKQNVSRRRARKIANVLNSIELESLAESDIYWDSISSISQEGTAEVFDLTIENHHNFLANDIIVHNSIEQDADVVTFLYRPEYYGIKTTPEGQSTTGLAEIIVGKQRNGPTGAIELAFIKEYARFENLTTASKTPFDKDNRDSRNGSGSSGDGTPPVGHDPGPDTDDDGDGEDGEAPF